MFTNSTENHGQQDAATAVQSNGASYILPLPTNAVAPPAALFSVASASIPVGADPAVHAAFPAGVTALPVASGSLWASSGSPLPGIPSAAPASAFLPTSASLNQDDQTATTLINNAIEKNAYHDYSRIAPAQLAHRISTQARKKPTFPQKLHTILSDEAAFGEIIMWMPHGRAWKIINDRRLEEEVLPNFFRHNSRASFLRQVNNWGFKRVLGGRDENAYYNEFFLRGLPHVCLLMEGCKPKNKKQDKPEGAAKEPDSTVKMSKMFDVAPDFYKISEVHPLPPSNGSGEPVPLDAMRSIDAQSLKNGVIPANLAVANAAVPGAVVAAAPNNLLLQQQLMQQQTNAQGAQVAPTAATPGTIASIYPTAINPAFAMTDGSNGAANIVQAPAPTENANPLYPAFNPMMGGIPNFNALMGQQPQQPQQQVQAQASAFPFNPFMMPPQMMGYPQIQQPGAVNGMSPMAYPPFPFDPAMLSLMQNAFAAGTPVATTVPSAGMPPANSSNLNALQAPAPPPVQPAPQPQSQPAGFPALNGFPMDRNMLSLMQNAFGAAMPTAAPTQQQSQMQQFGQQVTQPNGTAGATAATNAGLPAMNGIAMDPNMLSLMQNMQSALVSQQQNGAQAVTDSNTSSQQGEENFTSL